MSKPALSDEELAFLNRLCLESIASWAKKACEKGRPLTALEIHNELVAKEDRVDNVEDCIPHMLVRAIKMKAEFDRHQAEMGYSGEPPDPVSAALRRVVEQAIKDVAAFDA